MHAQAHSALQFVCHRGKTPCIYDTLNFPKLFFSNLLSPHHRRFARAARNRMDSDRQWLSLSADPTMRKSTIDLKFEFDFGVPLSALVRVHLCINLICQRRKGEYVGRTAIRVHLKLHHSSIFCKTSAMQRLASIAARSSSFCSSPNEEHSIGISTHRRAESLQNVRYLIFMDVSFQSDFYQSGIVAIVLLFRCVFIASWCCRFAVCSTFSPRFFRTFLCCILVALAMFCACIFNISGRCIPCNRISMQCL